MLLIVKYLQHRSIIYVLYAYICVNITKIYFTKIKAKQWFFLDRVRWIIDIVILEQTIKNGFGG